jgi:class 3 adenylate cyclase
MKAMTSPYLEWNDENGTVRRLEILDRVFIGRVCQGVDEQRRIIVNSPVVSRDHAAISLTGSQLEIRDMSSNGTWVNDIRVDSGSSKYLTDGDVIRVGKTLIHIKCPDTCPITERNDSLASYTQVANRIATVTHLVADVRGFSSMSQTRSSSEIYSLMKLIFERFSVIVHDNRGTIKDFPGDAVFAFWDHDVVPRKEQAVLACQSALKQAHSVNQIRAELSASNPLVASLKLGWGITTGEVTLSHYGSRVADLALVGDSVNLAFRLSGLANKDVPREVVICTHTAELVRDALPVEDLGMISVRGRSGYEHVYGLRASSQS